MNIDIAEIVDNFEVFDDWEDRYGYLIALGAKLPPMPENLKTEATKVQGCVSQVWMVPGWDAEGRLTLMADSDAQIVRGLIAILLAIFTGKTRAEIQSLDVAAIFGKLGLDQHLSPNRRNGFFSMVERVKSFTGPA